MLYELARQRMAEMIPFNTLLGIELVSVGDGVGEARLPFRPELANHIKTVHAAAIFGVAEAASGCAAIGALAPVILKSRLVASNATVDFIKTARSDLTARAQIAEAPASLLSRLAAEGKIVFEVRVKVSDQAGNEVALVRVNWHASSRE